MFARRECVFKSFPAISAGRCLEILMYYQFSASLSLETSSALFSNSPGGNPFFAFDFNYVSHSTLDQQL